MNNTNNNNKPNNNNANGNAQFDDEESGWAACLNGSFTANPAVNAANPSAFHQQQQQQLQSYYNNLWSNPQLQHQHQQLFQQYQQQVAQHQQQQQQQQQHRKKRRVNNMNPAQMNGNTTGNGNGNTQNDMTSLYTQQQQQMMSALPLLQFQYPQFNMQQQQANQMVQQQQHQQSQQPNNVNVNVNNGANGNNANNNNGQQLQPQQPPPQQQQQQQQPSSTLFIPQLPNDIRTVEQLAAIACVPTPCTKIIETNQGRRLAWITYNTVQDSQYALQQLNAIRSDFNIRPHQHQNNNNQNNNNNNNNSINMNGQQQQSSVNKVAGTNFESRLAQIIKNGGIGNTLLLVNIPVEVSNEEMEMVLKQFSNQNILRIRNRVGKSGMAKNFWCVFANVQTCKIVYNQINGKSIVFRCGRNFRLKPVLHDDSTDVDETRRRKRALSMNTNMNNGSMNGMNYMSQMVGNNNNNNNGSMNTESIVSKMDNGSDQFHQSHANNLQHMESNDKLPTDKLEEILKKGKLNTLIFM